MGNASGYEKGLQPESAIGSLPWGHDGRHDGQMLPIANCIGAVLRYVLVYQKGTSAGGSTTIKQSQPCLSNVLAGSLERAWAWTFGSNGKASCMVKPVAKVVAFVKPVAKDVG